MTLRTSIGDRPSLDDDAELLRVGRTGLAFAERRGHRGQRCRSRFRGTALRGCSRGARARPSRPRRSPAASRGRRFPRRGSRRSRTRRPGRGCSRSRGCGQPASRRWETRARSSPRRSFPELWPSAACSSRCVAQRAAARRSAARSRLTRQMTAARTSFAGRPRPGVSSVFWQGVARTLAIVDARAMLSAPLGARDAGRWGTCA